MVRVSSVAQFAASSKAIFVRRQAVSRWRILEIIDEAMRKPTFTMVAYHGGLLAALSISYDSTNFGQNMKDTIKGAKAAEAPAEAEAKEIIEYITSTLYPGMQAFITARNIKSTEHYLGRDRGHEKLDEPACGDTFSRML